MSRKTRAARRRILKWTCLGVLASAVLALGWLLWQDHLMVARLQAEIDGYRAAGEPIFVGDFNNATNIPDAENAALVYGELLASLDQTAKAAEIDRTIPAPLQAAAMSLDDLRSILEPYEKELHLLRRARGMEAVDWGVQYTSPMLNMLFPEVTAHRTVGKVAGIAIVFHARSGRSDEAVAIVWDTLAFARAIVIGGGVPQPSYLTSLTMSSNVCHALEVAIPKLEMIEAKASSTVTNPHGTAREQILNVIHALLDDTDVRRGCRESLQFERAVQLDTVQLLVSGDSGRIDIGNHNQLPGSSWTPQFLIRRNLVPDLILLMSYTSSLCEACLAANSVDGARLVRWSEDLDASKLDWLVAGAGRTVDFEFRRLAERRMAATALAIRLFESDHGRRPTDLSDLVPEYLDSLPIDPIAPGDVTIGYRPDAQPPVLFVGRGDPGDGKSFDESRYWGRSLDGGSLFYLDGDRPLP